MTEPTATASGNEYSPDGKRIWRVGTLTYTRGGLSNVFFWMLWGDFCLNLMDSGVIPNVIPLQMKKYGASNLMIGLLSGTLIQVLATAMVAIISTWSDRHRGPLGRRMPFILWSTPPLAICLALLGFSPQLAGWMKFHAPVLFSGISISSLIIATLAATTAAYTFFDNFPQSVYYYLWPDIIPAKLMGTFACNFRVVATLGVLLFNLTLLKHAEDSPGMICLIAAGLYLFAFLMLVFMVREPEYPPPEPPPIGSFTERSLQSTARYIRECYSHAYYWKIYLSNLTFICGYGAFRSFLLVYSRSLHIDLDTMGLVFSLRDILQIIVFLSLGPIVDRYHPIRAGIVATVFAFLITLLGAILTRFFTMGTHPYIHFAYDLHFFHWTLKTFTASLTSGQAIFALLAVLTFASVAIFQAATAALGPRILPPKQYGQFCSANAVIFHIGLMVSMPLSGWLFDHAGYRLIYVWFSSMTLLSSILIILLYFDWKRLGGDDHYQAPLVEELPPL
jgi:MFS family permease